MPLLFYFSLIIWMGMVEIMQDELRIPTKAKVKVGTPARLETERLFDAEFHYHAGARVISLMFT
jgi:hypothetical protein